MSDKPKPSPADREETFVPFVEAEHHKAHGEASSAGRDNGKKADK